MNEEDDATRSQRPGAPEADSAPAGGGGLVTRLWRKLKATRKGGHYLGRYRVLEKLGEGGMGVVYEAEDESLGRKVAVKTIHESDEASRKRFQREARAAAVVNHPNVCQVYEIGESSGELFIAMELLEGEPLSERLTRGAMSVAEAVRLGQGMLSALEALHESGMVHRDLKPSNVFLTPHGVKILDFGLARPLPEALARSAAAPLTELTEPGLIVGTPRYMAPEQLLGKSVDARTDLFGVGAILYEAVAGRRPFEGTTVAAVISATLHEQPPALAGDAAVVQLDYVLRRALSKSPNERPGSASEMAQDLSAVTVSESESPTLSGERLPARALTRLVVLPFRLLRPDPDLDYLRYALADALSGSLSGLPFVVLRSTAAAARFDGETPDLKALAAEADVDVAVFGRILHSGDDLRITTELVSVPSGTVLSTQSGVFPLDDIFHLQDELASRIVESLSASLGGSGASSSKKAPSSARAYEFYLRGNALSEWSQADLARDFFLQCVEEDPTFAPAWAKLGRSYRLLAKYYLDRRSENLASAEEAFRRALELDPSLALAHKLYAHHEAEVGRAGEAMKRLLALVREHRNRNDSELFSGLVHATRYCGLLEASAAAHREAVRLDPNVPTSAVFGLWALGRLEEVLKDTSERDGFLRVLSLEAAGRTEEALAIVREWKSRRNAPVLDKIAEGFDAVLERRPDAREAMARTVAVHTDPEALFVYACVQAHIDDHDAALATLSRSVISGYTIPEALDHPWLAALRGHDTLRTLTAEAEKARREHLQAFRTEGGEALLGVAPAHLR